MGQFVDDLLTASAAERILVKGTDYRALSNDRSVLMSSAASLSMLNNAHLFHFPMFWTSKSHINIKDSQRMECDDYYIDSSFSAAGSWEFYIR